MVLLRPKLHQIYSLITHTLSSIYGIQPARRSLIDSDLYRTTTRMQSCFASAYARPFRSCCTVSRPLNPKQVESADSLENIETKWKKEIEENCPGVKIVLVALKCDLREAGQDEEENPNEPKRPLIDYQQGLRVAQNIKALRYLGMLTT
jgi:GTPase SAR1 family protein